MSDHPCCFAAPGPVEAIGAELLRLTGRHFERRLAAIRQVIDEAGENGAGNFDAAARGLLELLAGWSPVALGSLMGLAFELAAWTGREEVFLDEEASFATEVEGQTFREQIDFLRQKRPRPTHAWTDVMQGEHDRAFVVAGATDIAMIEDFQTAVIRAAEGGSYRAFAQDFDDIVARYGWSYKGGREWRIRTIYETNLRTSAMAGRLRQMREPDVLKLRPYWQYVHAETRIPLKPRPQHVAWDGLILKHDDPWWDIHFPPNDWRCSCGVRSLSLSDLRRLGKTGPDTAPETVRRPYTHEASGETVMLPEGVGYGWDYQPGALWERGLVPSALIDEAGGLSAGRQKVQIDIPEPVEELLVKARPFKAEPLPAGLPDEDYVRAFLKPFNADIGKPVLWEDKTGTRIPVSDELFKDRSGAWKVGKRDRATLTPLLAEALLDPDEIWLGIAEKPVHLHTTVSELIVDRRYIRTDRKSGLITVFEIGRKWWQATTSYAPTDRKGKPDFRLLDRRRGGKLLWKRK